MASAQHDLCPPGWNKPQDVPKPMYDFRSSKGWDDYQRYQPGEVAHGSSAKSHPVTSGPMLYQMVPGGSHYHRVGTVVTTPGTSTQTATPSQSPGTRYRRRDRPSLRA